MVALCAAAVGWGASLAAAAEDPTFASALQPFLGQYCYGCHGQEKQKADINFTVYGPGTRLIEDRKFWEKIHEMLVSREMPPKKEEQPSEEHRAQVADFILAELAKFDCSKGPVYPGRVTLRRLNRAEYKNTVRDLVGVEYEAAADFPNDSVGYGFDNIGDVLSLPPMLMEKYLAAAEQIATNAVLSKYPPPPPVKQFTANAFKTDADSGAVQRQGSILGLFREATAAIDVDFPATGTYRIRALSYGDQAGPEPPRLAISLDGATLEEFDVPVEASKPKVYEVTRRVEAGSRSVAVAYLNNYVVQNHPNPALRGDRNLFVSWVEVEGPMDAPPPPPPETHRKIIPCDPMHAHDKECARKIFTQLTQRAYRRPVQPEEVDRLLEFVDLAQSGGGTFYEGIQLGLQAVLVSPRFLFRWELDPEPGQPVGVRWLNDWELASRLSYFLWSSMPDQELFDLAAAGRLGQPEVLDAQVRRMLQDPKAGALTENFASQWLTLRNLEIISPDPELFPEFDAALRNAMKRETELFFSAIMREDRSVRELLDADFTYLNERLARHYGIPDVEGEAFRKVALDESSGRGGILTHGSILTLTSNPTRTSPVIRGKWVLEQILGTPPPPPPPDVPELEETREASETASLRERLEVHRAKPECATCHNKMDPIGFAFENFNAIGAWRDFDGKFPVDTSGTLPNGQSIRGARDLKAYLKTQDTFARTLAEKMLTFALGRGLEYYDKCAVDDICAALAQQEYRFSVLASQIVRSEPFRKKAIGDQP